MPLIPTLSLWHNWAGERLHKYSQYKITRRREDLSMAPKVAVLALWAASTFCPGSLSAFAFQHTSFFSNKKRALNHEKALLRSTRLEELKNSIVNGVRSQDSTSSTDEIVQVPQKKGFFSLADILAKTRDDDPQSITEMDVENAMGSVTEIDPTDKVVMLGLLWITACLSALDRVAMSVALVPMTDEFGLTDTIKGSISSFFSVGYGLGIIPAGIILSFASPRLVMAVAVVGWSLATLATPWAAEGLAVGNTASALMLIRACVGAAESLVMPTLQRLLLAWTTPSEKAMGIATVVSGFQAGTIAAYLVSPAVMDFFGDGDAWRQLFYAYGGFGLALLLPWLLVAKDGPDSANSNNSPVSTTTLAPADKPVSMSNFDSAIQIFKDAPWSDFIRSKASWAMLLAHCSKNWGLYNTLAWMPTFYAEQYGIGIRDSAWLSVLPSVAGAVCGILAGNLADAVVRRQQEANDGVMDENQLTNIRKTFQGVALYGPAVALGSLSLNIPDDPVVAQSFLMAAVGLQAFTAAGFEAGNQEKAGTRWAGLLYSVTSLPAVIFGTTGVYCVGQILDNTGQDWSLVFGINALMNILGATAFVTMYNSKREFD
eukprot:scaffold2363_cov159-Amphora_coffeaeformis.AAC.26